MTLVCLFFFRGKKNNDFNNKIYLYTKRWFRKDLPIHFGDNTTPKEKIRPIFKVIPLKIEIQPKETHPHTYKC